MATSVRSIQALLAVFLMVVGSSAGAQPVPARVGQGMRPAMPAAIAADPVVLQCRMLTIRGLNPTVEPFTSVVEKAMMVFEFTPVFEAVAACRAALALYPSERGVIVAENVATEYLHMMVFGNSVPRSDADVVGRALEMWAAEPKHGEVDAFTAFLLGSAFEFGVGTAPDRGAAVKWYAECARLEKAICPRELARVQNAR